MRHRAFRSIAAILSILILTGVPAQAGPILINQVVQALGNQNALELRLPAVSRNSPASTTGVRTSVQPSTSNVLLYGSLNDDTMQSGVVAIKSDPLKTVQVIDEGNVDGTVCDCGEITVPGGAVPKWPLLFLAAIPLFFIHGCDVCDSSTSTPPLLPLPNPTLVIPPPGVPEPASLILFCSGLAAVSGVMRRRRAKNRIAELIQATDEDQSHV